MAKEVKCEAPDISVHNGSVNFKALREAGYNEIYLRAGYGKNNVDQRYIVNAEACKNLGIRVMVYWFSYALDAQMAGKEAEYAVAQAAKYWFKCPIAFDLEYDTVRYAATKGVRIDKALATDMAVAFLKKVKEQGYVPVIYLNKDYKINYFEMDRIQKEVGSVSIWYARYSTTIPTAELEGVTIWQYTSKGKISGIAGNVDLNRTYADLFVATTLAQSLASCNLYIQGFQQAANEDGYLDNTGSRLVEDGIDGSHTQAVRRKINLKIGSGGRLVQWWQTRLNEVMDVGLVVDGKFGKATRSATIKFQKQYSLQQDGIAGYNTLQMAFYQ